MSSPLLRPDTCPSLQGDVQSGDPVLVSPLICSTPLPLSAFLHTWRDLPGVSPCILHTIQFGYTLQFARNPPPPFQRGSSYCCEQRQRGFCPTAGSLLSSAQRGNRGGPLFGPKPWLLQPVLSSPEEGWGFASYTRSAQAELLPLQRKIQDADAQEHSFPGPRGGLVTVDLKDAYFHIQVVQRHRKFLRFAFRGKAYQYKVLPFGLALAPRTFTKCMDAALAPLRLQGIRILNYLDDWLILASSREQVIRHRDSLLLHLCTLGLRLNGQKSVLTPAQQTTFLGVCLDSTSMQACLAPARVESIQSCSARFRLGPSRVSGPVSQAPRPHGRGFPGSSLGAAPYETVPLVDEVSRYSPLLAIPPPTKSVRCLSPHPLSVAGPQFSPERSEYGGSLPSPNDNDGCFPLRVGGRSSREGRLAVSGQAST